MCPAGPASARHMVVAGRTTWQLPVRPAGRLVQGYPPASQSRDFVIGLVISDMGVNYTHGPYTSWHVTQRSSNLRNAPIQSWKTRIHNTYGPSPDTHGATWDVQ